MQSDLYVILNGGEIERFVLEPELGAYKVLGEVVFRADFVYEIETVNENKKTVTLKIKGGE